MTIVEDLEDDHYLHLSFYDQKIFAEFECLNHDECEAAQRVENSQEESYADYSIILEWFTGDAPTILRSDFVHLELTDESTFAQWSYLSDNPEFLFENYLNMLRKNVGTSHVYVGYVQRRKGPIFASYCVGEHQNQRQLCFGEWLNEIDSPIQQFSGAEHTSFRSDFINISTESFDGEDLPIWKYNTERTMLNHVT